MRNKAFQRALVCLAHPLSLGAILLLLVNDHLLKRHWPSWWTGKASDFAWLLFAPFITAALLAWLLPSRIEQQEEGVGLWAIALTGLVFSLAKTLPAFHTLMVRLLEALLGCAVGLRRDPTDLIALPSLLLAWRLWKHHAAHTHRLSHLKWVALVLATLSTVATTPIPPDYGVVCLQAQDDAIVATANFDHRNGAYDRFLSQDGGWTWQAIERGYDPLDCSHDDPWILTDPIIPSVQYRFTSGRSIERSEDGGQTWRQEVATALNEAQVSYYQQYRAGNIVVVAGPFSALIHRPTGNLVVAMGHEGVLVRTPDGAWHWAAVGPYSRAPLGQADTVLGFLSGEIVFTLLLTFPVMGFLGRRAGKTSPLGYVMLVLAWMLWGMTFFGLSPAAGPALSGLNLKGLAYIAAFVVAVVAIPVGLKRTFDLLIVSARGLGVAVVITLSGMLLFFLPYVLWSQGSIPYYRTATAFAFALALAVIVAGDQWLRHVMPIPSPRPKPAEMPQAMTLLHAGWKLWLQWLLGNAVGLGVGSLIVYIGITFSALTTGGPAVCFTGVLAIAATGALVSSIQWYVMQRHGNWAGEWSKWTLLSAAGWSIGGISGLPLGFTSGRLSIIAGVFCGIAQWLILRRRVNRAGWWILASAVGWLAGTLIELLFLGNPDWFFPIGFVVNGFIVGGVSGSISGLCLVWLLRRSATVPLPNDVESHEQQATKI